MWDHLKRSLLQGLNQQRPLRSAGQGHGCCLEEAWVCASLLQLSRKSFIIGWINPSFFILYPVHAWCFLGVMLYNGDLTCGSTGPAREPSRDWPAPGKAVWHNGKNQMCWTRDVVWLPLGNLSGSRKIADVWLWKWDNLSGRQWANFFCKGRDNIFSFVRDMVSVPTTQLWHYSQNSRGQCVNEWMQLYSNKTL